METVVTDVSVYLTYIHTSILLRAKKASTRS